MQYCLNETNTTRDWIQSAVKPIQIIKQFVNSVRSIERSPVLLKLPEPLHTQLLWDVPCRTALQKTKKYCMELTFFIQFETTLYLLRKPALAPQSVCDRSSEQYILPFKVIPATLSLFYLLMEVGGLVYLRHIPRTGIGFPTQRHNDNSKEHRKGAGMYERPLSSFTVKQKYKVFSGIYKFNTRRPKYPEEIVHMWESRGCSAPELN